MTNIRTAPMDREQHPRLELIARLRAIRDAAPRLDQAAVEKVVGELYRLGLAEREPRCPHELPWIALPEADRRSSTSVTVAGSGRWRVLNAFGELVATAETREDALWIEALANEQYFSPEAITWPLVPTRAEVSHA